MEFDCTGSDARDGDRAICTNFNAVSCRPGHNATIWVPSDIIGQRRIHPAIRHTWWWRRTAHRNPTKLIFDLVECGTDTVECMVSIGRRRLSAQAIEENCQSLTNGK